ncbi:MAG TPA: site-2 protease family protein [Pirellulales bacterium]|jgi:Zn-dependent protease|nr:site-2 protease family protein [Pirellulales bacterium]
MPEPRKGVFRLGRVAGIELFVHWSWLLVAYFEISAQGKRYDSPVWNVIEYLSLFGIVLLHEFGHALACRQVGGTANEIMLWPLGGVAYVSPPPRAGAVLWSIVAGPLVNVLLVPVTIGLYALACYLELDLRSADAVQFLYNIAMINFGLLVFNLLPIYPLDGGQILQSLLWFVIGRANSLYVVSSFGLIVGLGLIGLSVWAQDLWFVLISAFIAARCWAGFQQARALSRLDRAPRYASLSCPSCQAPPPGGNFWTCGGCRTQFDIFEQHACCPQCGRQFNLIQCPLCHQQGALAAWAPATEIDSPEAQR